MAKSKTKRADKEFDLLEKLKHENKRLKRNLEALRKQLERVDFERYSNLQELVDKQHREEEALREEISNEKLKEKWSCFCCGKGFLYLKIFNHPVKGVMYYRACNICEHRTKMQLYTTEVQGLKEEK